MSNFYGQYIGFSGGVVAPPPPDPWGDRAVFGGGLKSAGGVADTDTVDYFSISSLGSASDFGNLAQAESDLDGCSNGTRGVWAGGTSHDKITYITIASTGDASAFGDLTRNHSQPACLSNGNIGIIAGGYF